jgi:hypothetical protein
MRTTNVILLMCVLAMLIIGGCSAEFPVKWKPSEPQKQAADLAVSGIEALRPVVPASAGPIVNEAAQAARITQTYMGLPAERPAPVAAANAAMLAQAATDAARPAPTVGEIGNAVTSEIQSKADAAFGLADSVLALLATVAGTYGATKLGAKVNSWREQRDEAQAQANVQITAIKEIVGAIDQLAPDIKAQVKAVMAPAQKGDTPMLVAAVKNGAV